MQRDERLARRATKRATNPVGPRVDGQPYRRGCPVARPAFEAMLHAVARQLHAGCTLWRDVERGLAI
jgi:hypothetical protein